MPNKSIARLIRIVTGTFGTARDELFSLDQNLTRFERFVHFWVLVWRSFVRNRCPVRASALSYTTLLALIPMLAVAMSVTSLFLKSEGKERISQFIQGFVDNMVPAAAIQMGPKRVGVDPIDAPPPVADFKPIQFETSNFLAAAYGTNLLTAPEAATNHPAASDAKQTATNVSNQAANYIHQFVENTYSRTLGLTGVVFLFLTAILTLTRVEETFNDIWGVTRGRDWWARITNYLTTVIFGPLLIVGALGLMNSPNFQKTRDLMGIVPFLQPLLSTYLPVAVICLTFALFYKLIPNTRVDFSAALVGGSLAGISWHLYNQLGFLLASRAVSASTIYGGLALIPLLMGGLYVVWLTVLFGAQVAYAFQNRASYLQEKLAENVNQRGREFVALRLMTCIGQRFHRALPPATIREISAELGVPSKLAQQVLHTLLAARLVVETNGKEAGYSPARPLADMNCHHILLAMRATQGQELVTRDEPVRAEVLGEFARIQAAEKAAASSVTLLALVNRAQARLELLPAAAPEKEIVLTPTAPVAEPKMETEIVPGPPPTAITVTPEAVFASDNLPAPSPEPKPVLPKKTTVHTQASAAAETNEQSFPL